MRKITVAFFVLILTFVLMACNKTPEKKSNDSLVVGLAVNSQQVQFNVTLATTFVSEVEARGGTPIVLNANGDSSTQISQIEDLVTRKVDYIVVCPVDADALGNALDTANKAGIPVINLDSAVSEEDQGKVECIISSDNEGGGQALGEWLVDHLARNTGFGVFNYPQVRAIDIRVQKMMDVLREKRPDITIVYKDITDWNNFAAYAEDILMANPNTRGFFGINDSNAVTCMSVSREYGIQDAICVGFDGSPVGKQAIRDGDQSATCVNSCVQLSKAAVDAVYKLAAGEKIEFNISTSMWVIDKDNVAQYGYDDWN
jgi:ribose transport system substrate-binding protein